MLPAPEAFAAAAGALGLGDDDQSSSTTRTASARRRRGSGGRCGSWATTTCRVLDGGLPKWRAEGRPLETGDADAGRRRSFARALPTRRWCATRRRARRHLGPRREQVRRRPLRRPLPRRRARAARRACAAATCRAPQPALRPAGRPGDDDRAAAERAARGCSATPASTSTARSSPPAARASRPAALALALAALGQPRRGGL